MLSTMYQCFGVCYLVFDFASCEMAFNFLDLFCFTGSVINASGASSDNTCQAGTGTGGGDGGGGGTIRLFANKVHRF